MKTIEKLAVGGGSIAYESSGSGPLVVCIPGMGDLRSSYRYLAPALVAAGYRVVTTDLRGHGDSDATFADYGDEATARDVTALLERYGEPAVIVGNSLGAAVAVLVAAGRPELVRALVLIGPFVRDPKLSAAARIMMRVATASPWAALAWKAYLPSLYAGRRPADFDDYRATVAAAMARPGYSTAFSRTARTSHAPAEHALSALHTPTLVVMGALDPDFPQPSVEAEWIAARLGGEVLLVADTGHYPHSQRPDAVGPAIVSFLGRTVRHA